MLYEYGCSDARFNNLGGMSLLLWIGFFFQAEDGIRDLTVTGVQTCALPIWPPLAPRASYYRIRMVQTAPYGARRPMSTAVTTIPAEEDRIDLEPVRRIIRDTSERDRKSVV